MKMLLVSAALAAVAAPHMAAAQNVPSAVVAVVDVQRILGSCTACRSASAQLQSQSNAIEARTKALSGQLQTEGNGIQTAANALNGKEPDAALKARYTAFQSHQQAAEQEIANRRNTLQSTTANVQNQIAARLNPIVNTVMGQRGANLVMEKNATMANAPSLDITDTVLAELNRQLPAVSVTPLPAASRPAASPAPKGR